MNNNSIIRLLLIFSLLGCGKEYEYQHHSNGNIRIKAETENSIRNGELLEYYSDGNLKSKQVWKDGKQHGPFVYYYKNGELWANGNAVNGIVLNITKYYESGGKSQFEKYDSLGYILDIENYNEDGSRDSVGYAIFFIPRGDTVLVNSDVILKARVVNVTDELYKNGKLYITSGFDTLNNELNEPLDTIRVIFPKQELEYEYSFKAKDIGQHFIFGQFVFEKKRGKDIIIVTQKVVYSYHVINDVGQLPKRKKFKQDILAFLEYSETTSQ